jgi:hypothetical protein
MSGIQADNKVILHKKEVTYGIDPVPTLPLLTRNYVLKPGNAGLIERLLDKPAYGADPALITGVHCSSSFEVDAAGSGTAGTAPAWGDTIMAAGHSETVNVGVSVLYKPVSSGFSSETHYAHKSGILHKQLGWRASAGFDLTRGGAPSLKFDGQALYVVATDTANPTPSFAAWRVPKPVDKTNTATATLNGVALELQSLLVNFGQQLVYLNMPNLEGVFMKGRKATASIEFLKKTVAIFNPVALMQAETLLALQAVHGLTAGNIIQFDAAKAQIIGVDEGEIEGQESWKLNLSLTATSAGDDDYVITVK